MGRLVKMLAICAVIGFAAQSAKAELVIQVQGTGGENSLDVNAGDLVDLVIMASGPGSDTFASFAFDVIVGNGGLPVTQHALSADFNGGFDFSDRSDGSNLHFEGATAIGAVANPGQLVSLTVDTTGAAEGSSYTYDVRPDFVELDFFTSRDSVAGQTFTLNIVPEPMTLALLGVGGLVALRRRRTA